MKVNGFRPTWLKFVKHRVSDNEDVKISRLLSLKSNNFVKYSRQNILDKSE